MNTPQPLVFLRDDVFGLLVRAIPNTVLHGFEVGDFEVAVGTTKERFRSIGTDFEARTGFSKDEALVLLQALMRQTAPAEVA